MGSIYLPSYTTRIPSEAKIVNGIVEWEGRDGKPRQGKLATDANGNQRVLIASKKWVVQYTDENGKTIRVATKIESRNLAQKMLNKLEEEVERIRAGVVTREETVRSSSSAKEVSDYLAKYKIKMQASRNTANYIRDAMNRIETIFNDQSIKFLSQFNREKIEKWIANQLELQDQAASKARSTGTINTYLATLRGFGTWCVECEHLAEHPMKRIKSLNSAIGRKKERRSFTEEELKRIFEASRTRRYNGRNRGEEHVLIYRLLAGTGLRATELGLSTPLQFDFKGNRFFVKADKTKNKKEGILPIRPALMADLKKWIDEKEIKPNERIFSYSRKSIHRALMIDLKAAGIAKKGDDGRSVDVHSFRRTFGTMLARAGVPLTTTQKLMRHSTPELTAKLYIDVEPIEMAAAVDKLPTF